MIIRSFLAIVSLLTALASPTLIASTDSNQIKTGINKFMTDHITVLHKSYDDSVRIEYQIGKLDPRLAMPDCPQPLSTELKSQHNIGRINIRISCEQQNPWSLYVPVKVKLYQPIVSTIHPVNKGKRLTGNEVEMREIDTSRLNGSYFTNLSEVIGMQARRNLRPNQPVLANQLQPPLLVKKGDAVQVSARSGGLTVKIPGVALMDGHKGQQISIRNNQSKRVVEARVSAPGQVEVAM